MYKVKISDEAELDLEEAYQWYETQVNQLGSEFIRRVDDSLSSILKNPFACPLIYQNVRRIVGVNACEPLQKLITHLSLGCSFKIMKVFIF